MLEEQGQGVIKELLSKLLSKVGISVSNTVDNVAQNIYHNVAETGKVNEKKLIKLDNSVMPFGEPMDSDTAKAVAIELKKYNIAYAIKSMSNGKCQFIGHSKHSGNFELAVKEAMQKQLKPKNSIKNNIYRKVKDIVQTKQNSKEHNRQQPLKHRNVKERS